MTSAMNLNGEFCLRLTFTLLHFLWQGVAIALLALAACAVLRRAAAAMRYWALVAALAAMALCPPVTFLTLAPRAELQQIGDAAKEKLTSPTTAHADSGPVKATAAPGALVAPTAPAAPLPREVTTSPDHPSLKERLLGLISPESCRRAAPFVAMLYFFGVLLMLARLLLALRGGRGLRGQSRPVTEAAFLASLARAARAVRLRALPAVAWCERVAVPTVIGILKPTILLPLSLSSGLSAAQVEMLLLHELAHLRRHDHWLNLAQWLIETVLFFHPAVWLISRRIRAERELACDDMVLAAGVGQAPYAESLLRMAELSRLFVDPGQVPALSLGSHGQRFSGFGQRVLRLVEGREPTESPRPARLWPLGLMLLFLLLGIFFFSIKIDARNGVRRDQAQDSRSQLQIVAWSLIVDEPLAQTLKERASALQGAAPYQSSRIGSDMLMRILQAEKTDTRILSTDTNMGWLEMDNFPIERPLDPLFIHYADQKTLANDLFRETDFTILPSYKVSGRWDGLHLEWHGHGRASLNHYGPQAKGNSNASADGEFKFSGDLKAGDGVIFLAPMGKVMRCSPWHLIVLQAVSVPGDVVQDLQGLHTDQWIKWGVEGAIRRIRQTRAWEKEAAVPDSEDGRWSCQLPNGGAIRIVAVAQPSRWPMHWWNAGGGAVEHSPFWDKRVAHIPLAVVLEQTGLDGPVNYEPRLRPNEPVKGGTGLSGAGGTDMGTDRVLLSITPPSGPGSDQGEILEWFDAPKPFDFAVTYGTGPWEEVGTIREGETRDLGGGKFSLEKVEPRSLPRLEQVFATGRFTYDSAFQITLVGVDKRGRRSDPPRGGGGIDYHSTAERPFQEFIPMAKGEIDHFLILRRATRTHVFKGIAPAPQRVPQEPARTGLNANRKPSPFVIHYLADRSKSAPHSLASEAEYRWRIDTTETLQVTHRGIELGADGVVAGSWGAGVNQAGDEGPVDLIVRPRIEDKNLVLVTGRQNKDGSGTEEKRIPVPEGSRLESRWRQGPFEMDGKRYVSLWEGRFVRDGKAVETVLFAAAAGPMGEAGFEQALDLHGRFKNPPILRLEDIEASNTPISLLQLRWVATDAEHGRAEQLPWHDEKLRGRNSPGLWILKEPLLIEDAVLSVEVQPSSAGSDYTVFLQLKEGSRDRLAQITAQGVGRRLALVVGGKVVAAPTVRAKITDGKLSIAGGLSKQAAVELASAIKFANHDDAHYSKEVRFLDQWARVDYDDRNHVIFEDIGRKTYGRGGFSAGSGVRLHVVCDGQFRDIDLSDEFYIKGQVWSITYSGKDKVWIASRLGHRGNGKVLVNLSTGKVEQRLDNLGGGDYKPVEK